MTALSIKEIRFIRETYDQYFLAQEIEVGEDPLERIRNFLNDEALKNKLARIIRKADEEDYKSPVYGWELKEIRDELCEAG